MPSPRILSARALVERDIATTVNATGSRVPDWHDRGTIAAAPPQPMTDKLKRTMPGDIAETDYYSLVAVSEDVRKADRMTFDGTRYRVEALRKWTSGSTRVQHIDLGLKVV